MNWDPTTWKRSQKLLLGVATIWPLIYIFLFMVIVVSLTTFFTLRDQRWSRNSESIDLIQLQQKIRNNELSRMTVTPNEIVAWDRACQCEYHTSVSSGASRAEILRLAAEVDQNGKPHVPRVEEETSTPAVSTLFPVGIVVLFACHFFTILMMMALLVLYILLAVKREQFDQTTRIVWIIMLCFMSIYVMPVYWYLYVWRGSSTGAGTPSAT